MKRVPSVLSTGPLLAGLLLAPVGWAQEIGPADLARLPEAQVVIVGEIHDNPKHHENQALVAAALRPKALVFEMFGPGAALAATPENRRSRDSLAEALEWDDSGWPDFTWYYPIFVAAPDAAVFGGAVPRDDARRAVQDGAARVLGGSASLFGLDQALSYAQQDAREALQKAAHCDALPDEMLSGMVEAQRLRDAALSRAVVAALAEAGPPVLVITGNGHARRDWGIPAMLRIAAPDSTVLSLGQLEAPPGETSQDAPPFDHWLVTEPADRDDPCEAFR